jgi:hypothetical protein
MWDIADDQAAVFVAEALISDPPDMTLHNRDAEVKVVVFVWSVGGDTITLERPLAPLIVEFGNDYDSVRSTAQADDVAEQIAALDEVEKAIKTAKSHMQDMLKKWEFEQGAAKNRSPA